MVGNRWRRLVCSAAVLMWIGVGCFSDEPPPEFHGEAAKEHLYFCDRDKLPATLNDLWVYDGGTFNGSSYYVTFECDTIDDCWSSLSAFGAPNEETFLPGIQTEYAVVALGPSFYVEGKLYRKWDLPDVASGMSHEWELGGRLHFYAIDLNRKRVYFHYESGGFPTDPPEHGWRGPGNDH